jgi:hypothetical protein
VFRRITLLLVLLAITTGVGAAFEQASFQTTQRLPLPLRIDNGI